MNSLRFLLGAVLAAGGSLTAQTDPTAVVPAPIDLPTNALRSADELEQLVAPIALYPDALIAIILPATVAATDVVLAARHLRDFPNDRSQIEHRAWDESVKSLTHYPDVLKWMDENLPWTKQVGEAFALQPADVMQAVQRLRTRARANGTLVDTPQQQVIAEPDVIRIVPSQPEVIYVPRYEPEILFVSQPHFYTVPMLSFGVGARVGSWLAYDCDWRSRTIWVGDRHRSWRGHDWRRPIVPISPGFTRHVSPPHGIRQWCPPPRTVVQHRVVARSHDIIRPSSVASPTQRTWSRPHSSFTRSNPTVVNRTTPTVATLPTRTTHVAPATPHVSRGHSSTPQNHSYTRSSPAVAPQTSQSHAHATARSSGHWQQRGSNPTRHVTPTPSAVPVSPPAVTTPPQTAPSRDSRSHGHRSSSPRVVGQPPPSEAQPAPAATSSSSNTSTGRSHAGSSSRRGDYRSQR
jgi:hypothetical protein